jgi:hypothetical protein
MKMFLKKRLHLSRLETSKQQSLGSGLGGEHSQQDVWLQEWIADKRSSNLVGFHQVVNRAELGGD